MGNVHKYTTSAGRRIYSFAVTAFPTLIANIHIIDDGTQLTLVDTGSGLEQSNKEFLAGFAALRDVFGVSFTPADLDLIIITHGHVDHFGGLPFLRHYSDAPVGIHVLDQRVLSNYDERIVIAAHRLERFLAMAGVPAERRSNLMFVYLWAKNRFEAQRVDFTLAEGTPAPAGFQVYHVPGHCPGQICLRVDDYLLTADHVLARITPHQAPESITHNMGLGHYLDSLQKIARLDGIHMGLGGHEGPIQDVGARVEEIRRAHEERLARTLEICQEPRSIAEISSALFGHVESYHVLLALEEAGAHVEYLHQRGNLVAANLDEIQTEPQPVIRYLRS